MTRPLTPCCHPGCPDLCRTSYCDEHAPPARSGRKMPVDWKATRKRIAARDGGICHWCGRENSTSCDHIVPVSKGGSDDDSNLVCSCWPCNQRRGNRAP